MKNFQFRGFDVQEAELTDWVVGEGRPAKSADKWLGTVRKHCRMQSQGDKAVAYELYREDLEFLLQKIRELKRNKMPPAA